ncbi:MAG: hypothetical protein H6658_17110 [Ardenticatenaceae bacterium]|nr:hypothetical protein [Ardenticatenaceae bacterium]
MGVKRLLSRVDPGWGVVLLISIIAIWPFLSIASLPQETDAELHIFRLHELASLVSQGEWYPRWAPDFYHGFGYPIFNYYAPLTYYLAVPVTLLPQFDAVDGVKMVFVLGMLLGAMGLYGFVRDNWGRQAGFVASAVFLYAPYVQYIDPHARGVLPESFSFGALAMALWLLDRVGQRPSGWRWVTAVFFTAAVILSHNLMALLFFGLLLAWGVWSAVNGKWQGAGGKWWWPLVALVLGLGLAAFFWLPVWLERDAVNLNTLLGQGDNYDFHTHFLSLAEMLAFSQRLDWGATEPAFRFNLGVAQWGLTAVSLLLLFARRVKQTGQMLFFGLATAVLIFLMLPASAFVWENVPGLPFFQFPWRLLGPAALMMAVVTGAGTEAMLRAASELRRRVADKYTVYFSVGVVTAVLVITPILLGLPMSQPVPWPDFEEVNTLRMSVIEQRGRWLGTTSTADYVPRWVSIIPKRNSAMVQGFFEGKPLDRVNWANVPDAAVVEQEEIRPLHFRYHITSPKKFQFRLFLFDFPGWQASIDGEPVAIEVGRPEGFIVIPMPEGEHVVDVQFGTTPARTLAGRISTAALLVTLVVALFVGAAPDVPIAPGNCLADDKWVIVGVVGVTAVTLLLLNPLGWLHYHSSGFTAQPAAYTTFADFGDQIALVGYDAAPASLQPDDTLTLTLYWQAKSDLDINYQVFVHIQAADGFVVAQSDRLNPGDFPTRRWPLDKYVRDVHEIHLPAALAPGTYTVSTGLWVQTEGWRLPLLNEAEQQIGDNFQLFEFVVK